MRMIHRYKLQIAVAALLLAILAGCTTPEARRERGDGYGTGADPGNHPAEGVLPRSKVFAGESEP